MQVCFKMGKASPCSFHHEELELLVTVHGDDFTVTGPMESLLWMEEKMKQKFEVTSEILGPEEGSKKEIKVLNRTIRWTSSGVEYEPDQRHADLIITEMGMTKAKTVVSPTAPEDKDEKNIRDSSQELRKEDASRYRGLAARLNYLALDRTD